jgi:quinolinate synthase
MNSLQKIRDVLANPRPEQIITLEDGLRKRAAACIERMFELAA